MIGDRTRTVIIAVVTTVWALNFTAGLVLSDYKPSESINGIFMAIVGGLFALGARQGSSNGGSGNNRSSGNSAAAPPEPQEQQDGEG